MAKSLIALPQPSSGPMPTGRTVGVCWSPNGTYCAVHTVGSPYFFMLKKVGETLISIPTANLGTLPVSESRAGGWTADSQYYIFGQTAAPSVGGKAVKNNGDDTFTTVAAPGAAGQNAVSHTALSPDDQLIAVARFASPWVQFYHPNPYPAYTAALALTYVGGAVSSRIFSIQISGDMNYVLFSHLAAPWYSIYRITNLTASAIQLTKVVMTSNNEPSFNIHWSDFVPFSPGFMTLAQDKILRVYGYDSDLAFSLRKTLDITPIAPNSPNTSDTGVTSTPNGRDLVLITGDGGKLVRYNPSGNQFAFTEGEDIAVPTPALHADVHPTGQYVAFAGDIAPWFRWYKIIDRIITQDVSGFGTLAYGPPTEVNVAASFKSLTSAASVASLDAIDTDNYAPQKYNVNIDVTAPPVSQMFAQSVQVIMSFGSLTGQINTMLRARDDVAATFQSLTMDIEAMIPVQSWLEIGFGSLTTDAYVMIPVQYFAEFAFQSLTTEIDVSRGSMSASVEVSFGSLTTDAYLREYYPDDIAASFQSLTTEAIVSVPEYYYADFAFGSLTADLEAMIPWPINVTTSFQPLSAELEGNVPRAIWVEGSFGRLESEVVGNVPRAIWISGGFQSLTSAGLLKIPAMTYTTMSFGSFSTDPVVMVPIPVYADLAFGSMTMDLVGNAPEAAWIDGSFSTFTSEIGAAGLVSSDTRIVFGRLTTRVIIGYPIEIEGEIVLPFLDAAGQLLQTNFLGGDVILPFLDVVGQLEMRYDIRAAVELPFLDTLGEINLSFVVNGELVLPFIETAADLFMDLDLDGDIVLPFVEVSGNSESSGSSVGSAPTLVGGTDAVHLGGGVFFGFSNITIG